jgi:ribokinase
MPNRVLVLGSSNVDLVLKVPRFHDPGETILGGDLVTAWGGKGANQAIAARKLGAEVAFITKLGDDPFGKNYRRYLIRNGLKARYLLGSAGLPTGVALIEVGPKGENRIVVAPGANASLSIQDLKRIPEAWKGVRVFATQLEIPLPTVKAALRLAGRAGAVTLLNPSPVTPLPADVLSTVDFLVLNATEAGRLAGREVRTQGDLCRAAERLLKKVANVVITRGARGVFYKNREEEIWVDPFPVKAIDTTAAGDAFVGALAAGLAEGKAIDETLVRASAAGAFAATRLGAQPSLPGRRDLQRFLAGSAAASRENGRS